MGSGEDSLPGSRTTLFLYSYMVEGVRELSGVSFRGALIPFMRLHLHDPEDPTSSHHHIRPQDFNSNSMGDTNIHTVATNNEKNLNDNEISFSVYQLVFKRGQGCYLVSGDTWETKSIP